MPPENPSARSLKNQGRNAYWIVGVTLSAVLITGVALTLPSAASAFWPFSITNASGASQPILPDASLDLLSAPASTEVDDTISNSNEPITSDGSALVAGVDYDSSTTVSADESDGDVNVSPTNTSGTISTYTVKPGDTLSGIASNFGVSENTILWANDITDKSTIKPGETLVILPVDGIQHTVRSGETLSSIAEKYGGNAADIAQFNGISVDSSLQSGSTIIIPGGEISGGSGSTTKKSSSKTISAETTPSSSYSASSQGASSSVANSTPSGSTPECDNTSGNPCHGIYGATLRGFFTNPLPTDARVTQGLHGWDAVDLAVPAGTPILAAAAGTVILSNDDGGWNGGYGNYVILDNGDGVQTLYAHMIETKATVGESVPAGQTIGYVGMTGDATGDHLHFEVRGAQNPFAFCFEGMYSDSCFNP